MPLDIAETGKRFPSDSICADEKEHDYLDPVILRVSWIQQLFGRGEIAAAFWVCRRCGYTIRWYLEKGLDAS